MKNLPDEMDYDDPNPFKAGETYSLQFAAGLHRYKIHILAIIEERQVVYRWYGKHKQWWHYEINNAWSLYQDIKRGRG